MVSHGPKTPQLACVFYLVLICTCFRLDGNRYTCVWHLPLIFRSNDLWRRSRRALITVHAEGICTHFEELALAEENVSFCSSAMRHGSQGGHRVHSGLVIAANSNIRQEKTDRNE